MGLGFRIVVLMPRSGTTTIFTMLSIAYSCFYSYSLILTIHRSATDKGGCRYIIYRGRIGGLHCLCGGRPKTLVYILYKAGTCEKQNECFSVVAKDPRKHGERAGERVI